MSFLPREMVNAIMESKPKSIHTVKLGGKEFILECDVEQMEIAIESLKDKFDINPSRYGYQYYQCSQDDNITKDDFISAIDDFNAEFHKRLELDYLTQIIKDAKKKKNGTFNKGRVYDEYILQAVANNGSGAVNLYKVKYEVVNDLVIRLIFHYTTEYLKVY